MNVVCTPGKSEFRLLLRPVTKVQNAFFFIVVDMATGCRRGWSGNRISVGRDFSHPSRPALWPTQLPIEWIRGLFLRGKAAGAWR